MLHVLAFYSHHQAYQITKYCKERISERVIFNDRMRPFFSPTVETGVIRKYVHISDIGIVKVQ